MSSNSKKKRNRGSSSNNSDHKSRGNNKPNDDRRHDESQDEQLARLTGIVESGSFSSAKSLLSAMHPAEIADLLESLPYSERHVLWEMVDSSVEGDVLMEAHDEVRATLVGQMDSSELQAASRHLELDDLADFIQSLPEKLTREVLSGMTDQHRKRLEQVLSYPEDSAGGLMDLDTITLREDVTLDVVLRYLRRQDSLPKHTDRLIVVDNFGIYVGELPMRRLLTNKIGELVSTVMRRDGHTVPVSMSQRDVARLFEDYDLVSAAVVDDDNHLIGRITIDDVVDVIREEAEQSVLSMAGLSQEDDIFAPALRSARKRAVWLGINLLTALLASWVISRFQLALDSIVLLAVLMTIVPSMGGIAGNQTLTLVIRGQALGQVNAANSRVLLLRELTVALINGCLWAAVVCLFTYIWFGNLTIGLLLGIALAFNLLCAAFSGLAIPLLLKRVGTDPALAGGVLLTTITDVVGVVAFLGLASWFLL